MVVYAPTTRGGPGPPNDAAFVSGDLWYDNVRHRFNGPTWVAQDARTVTALTAAATVSIDPTLGDVFTLTPAQNETLNMASVVTGQILRLIVTTSGTTSYTLTFGTSLVSAGTLATGTTTAQVFVISFVSDGTNYNEISRTTVSTSGFTTPLVIGGTATTSTLTLRSTSGVGAAGADIIFQVGNNGSVEGMRILNSGNVGIGTASPLQRLHVTTGASGTQVQVGTPGYLSYFGSEVHFAAQATLSSVGVWTAKGTAATVLVVNRAGVSADFQILADTGLTDGNTYSPTARLTLTGGGLLGIGTVSPTAALHIATAGAASQPGLRLDGAWFTGGTATTTKPQLLVEPSGATTNNWSTSGTGLGINAASGFVGNLLDLQLNGAARMSLTSAGTLTVSTSIVNPTYVGGTGTTSTLTLKSTSGVGAAGADIIFQVGNNGATEAARILNAGRFGVGTATPNTTFHAAGGFSLGVVSKTAAYTVTVSDFCVLCDATTAAFTVTLPAASNTGMIVEIIKTDASVNAVTVSRAGADTIQGGTTKSLALRYDKTKLIADGTATWYDLDTGLI